MKRLLLPVFALSALLVAGCASGDAESQSEAAPAVAEANLPEVTVYKSATCQCCAEWVDHMKQAGFSVKTMDMPNVQAVKNDLGVPQELRSCHTAYISGEVFEGHVPASVIKQYLQSDTSKAQGLAVPGMPIGSPGMEMPDRPAQPYSVIAFREGGRASVYSRQNQQ